MHPYRDAPVRATRRRQVAAEDTVLHGLLVGVGLIPVAIAVIDRAVFGFEATLGLIMVVIGIAGSLVRAARARREI